MTSKNTIYIEKLQLLNFKNYEEATLLFSPEINILTGQNGSGKTNLLDAIHFISVSKSAFNLSDSQCIMHGHPYFLVSCNISGGAGNHLVQCSFQQGQKKVLKIDKKPYEKITEHIGKFPVVLITPYDTDLIREGSEERRKFFDSILSQLDSNYLNDLIHYNHFLKQRNSSLKKFRESGKTDFDLLESYDSQIIPFGQKIHKSRKDFIKEFLPFFHKNYDEISDKAEQVNLVYESQLTSQNFGDLLKKSREKDIVLERTTTGVHRDDYNFLLKDLPIKNLGSQGQQKSFVIGLKLGQYDIIQKKKELCPLLLLDDIFDKLDEKRIEKLLQMIGNKKFGQLFITEARLGRSRQLLEGLSSDLRIFKVENGRVQLIDDKQGQ
ncbi:MAG: DNA replication/repair protein RecF [Cytophagaceae bacterium]